MVRLSLIEHGPHYGGPYRQPPIFPATFSEKFARVTGLRIFSQIIWFIVLRPCWRHERWPICVDLTGKAFENVLDKYRFAPDDGSPPGDIFLPVRVTMLLTCQYLLGTKSDP